MKVLVAGWIGSTNLGDELVFAGMRRLLAEQGARVVAVSQDPAATLATHGIKAVSGNDLGAIARAVRLADGVVFGGGGLLQDDSSALNLPYHLSRVGIARTRHTPFVGVGLGVGGLSTALGRRLVRRGMTPAEAISVRDVPSQALLTEVGVPGSLLAADTAFALEPPPVEPRDHLVVCLRRWSGDRGRVPASLRGDPTPQPQVEALAAALDASAEALGLQVRFVAFQRDRDDALHRRVAEHMSSDVSFATPGLDEVLEEVAAARVVVSMRYHGGIAATLAGRPTVLIDYASKVGALAEELGDGARLHGFEPDDLASIPLSVQQVVDHEAAVVEARQRLTDRQDGNRTAIHRLVAAAS